MDKKRADEIVNSLGIIEVLHHNSPVWIENVDEEMASIEYLDRFIQARVPLTELYEND